MCFCVFSMWISYVHVVVLQVGVLRQVHLIIWNLCVQLDVGASCVVCVGERGDASLNHTRNTVLLLVLVTHYSLRNY